MPEFKLRVIIQEYHQQVIKKEIQHQLTKMYQKHSNLTLEEVELPPLNFSIDLLTSNQISSNIGTYDPLVLWSSIFFDRTTSGISITTCLKDQPILFPLSTPTTSNINFDNPSGILNLPQQITTHLLTSQILSTFQLPLFIENIQFSYSPFSTYFPMESRCGKVILPTTPGAFRSNQVSLLPVTLPPVQHLQEQDSQLHRRDENRMPRDMVSRSLDDQRRSHIRYDRDITDVTNTLLHLNTTRYEQPHTGTIHPPPSTQRPTPPLASSNDQPTDQNPPPLSMRNQSQVYSGPTIPSINSQTPHIPQPNHQTQPPATTSAPALDGAASTSNSSTDTTADVNTSKDNDNILEVIAKQLNQPNTMDLEVYRTQGTDYYSLPTHLTHLNANILKELNSVRQKDILDKFSPFYFENSNKQIACDKKLLNITILKDLENIYQFCQKNNIGIVNTQFQNHFNGIRKIITRSNKNRLEPTN